MLLKLNEFNKRYLSSIDKIATNPKQFHPKDFYLPENSVIHFIGDSDQTVGVDSTHPLIRNTAEDIYSYHETKLEVKQGNITEQKINTPDIIRRYHKSHLNIKQVMNLDKSLSNNIKPIIIDYSLLPRLYKYTANALLIYQEWYNIRSTIWDMVSQIGTRRIQFLVFKLPKVLPTKAELTKYSHNFTASGLNEFYNADILNLLELWRMITPDIGSVVNNISEEILENVNIVFVESGIISIIQLEDLVAYAEKDSSEAEINFYRFLDNLISLRSPVDVKASDVEDINLNDVSNSKIVSIIKEHGQIGALSENEQKGLIKLSEKWKTIQDPLGSGKTLEDMVVTKEDLTLDKTKLLEHNGNIHDDTMLHSTLQEMSSKYITEVLHKDIIQCVMMLHPAGIIVKDIKVKKKVTAVTKTNTYAIQVQPINGPASTFSFTINDIQPDGTFKYRNTNYRLDFQKGSIPILKSDPDQASLTSYYGKVFVTRNDSATNNYSKWILKQIVSRFNNKDDTTISDVVYGINKVTDLKVPRRYSAVCENVDNLIVNNKYKLMFNPSRIETDFDPKVVKQLRDNEITPCGYEIKGMDVLGMDIYGTIHKFTEKASEELGSLSFLIDEDLEDGPIEYTEFSVFNKRIPTILAIIYINGLDKGLEKLNIPFSIHPVNVRLPYKFNEFKLKFKDIIYVIDISNIYNRLLIGGFNAIKNDISKYRGSAFNSQGSYSSILSRLGITNYHLREVKLMWDIFVDPITKGLLVQMGEKTDFYELLLRASSMLIDDHVPDVNTTRYKGYERIAGMVYKELVETIRKHRAQGAIANLGVSMNPQAVLLNILKDESQALVEESNPIHNLKEHEAFTNSGSGGRKSVTMVKETRAYTKHDLGVVSESTPDSAKVAVRAYFSANPNIIDLRGNTRPFDPEKDGAANAISTSAMNSPGVTHDDAKRV